MKDTASVPRRMQPIFDEVVRLTDEVCTTHLNEEYATLARAMTAALCRKRPSPIEHGPLRTWACGIVYAVGSLNFLFDKSQTPYMSAGDLAALFGLSKSTAGAKGRLILDSLKISDLDWHWYLPSRLANHPTAWLIDVDGFIVDVRTTSPEIQEEALRRGLIPFLP